MSGAMEHSVKSTGKVRTLIVDDAAFMRRALVTILSREKDIEIVGVAKHGKDALEAIDALDPDVVTLDVDMPVMDGITTIRHIMVRQPRPVIMVSALADNGRIALEALRLGAVDFFPKPSGTISTDMEHKGAEIGTIVKRAAQINRKAIIRARWKSPKNKKLAEKDASVPSKVLFLWATGGGCTSYIRFLGNVSASPDVAVIILQDVQGQALPSFCKELNNHVEWRVKTTPEGSFKGGECLLLSRLNYNIRKSKNNMQLAEEKATPTKRDLLLRKVAEGFGSNCRCFLLSGRPDDIKILKSIQKTGVQIAILDPKKSVSDHVCETAVKEGLGPSLSEALLWERASALSDG